MQYILKLTFTIINAFIYILFLQLDYKPIETRHFTLFRHLERGTGGKIQTLSDYWLLLSVFGKTVQEKEKITKKLAIL